MGDAPLCWPPTQVSSRAIVGFANRGFLGFDKLTLSGSAQGLVPAWRTQVDLISAPMWGEDLAKPDFGDAVPIEPDELPVFWACGVTPQAAIAAAQPPFAITHAPCRMLVTDLKNAQLAAI